MGKNPSDVFYWNDWESDTGLRACSLAAQGLWMRMLCIMAKAEPYGYLKIEGVPCTDADLARQVGESAETVAVLLGELKRRNVFSQSGSGIIKSRKMVKRDNLSKKRSKAGSRGADVTHGKTKGKKGLPRQTTRQTGRQTPRQRDGPSILQSSKEKIPKRKSRISDGFPDQRALLWAKAKLAEKGKAHIDPAFQAEKFRDVAAEKAWLTVDWMAKWRNFIRNAIDWDRGPSTASKAVQTSPYQFDDERKQA